MRFSKYQALGNDYLVVEEAEWGTWLSPERVQRVCDRHLGVGCDGILVSGAGDRRDDFRLRVLNPDGSEAEKSGNGLRIYVRFLWDEKRVATVPFSVRMAGGSVRCQVLDAGARISVEMGVVGFRSTEIPVTGRDREVLGEVLEVAGERVVISAATLGNPHCVVIEAAVSAERARALGPALERHPAFPRRTNVQFVQRLGPSDLRVEIWERGAGYTLASGTSACAAAAVCVRLGHCRSPLRVHMPGGELAIAVDSDFRATLVGSAHKVIEGALSQQLLESLG